MGSSCSRNVTVREEPDVVYAIPVPPPFEESVVLSSPSCFIPISNEPKSILKTRSNSEQKGFPPRRLLNDKNMTIHNACMHGYTDVVRWLLDHGSKVTDMDELGKTPLHHARNHDIIKMLLDEGSRVDSIDIYEKTPLHRACEHGLSSESIDLLLIHCPHDLDVVNSKCSFGNTPLHYASSIGSVKIVLVLLKHGASRKIKDKHGKTPYESVPKCFKGSMSILS